MSAAASFRCLYCGTDNTKKSNPGKAKYCSHECHRLSRVTKRHYPCQWCGSLVYRIPSATKNGVFCSHSCSALYHYATGKKPRTNKPRRLRQCLCCSKETANPKYCSIKCKEDHKRKTIVDSWLSGQFDGSTSYFGSSGISQTIRNYLLETRGDACWVCGWDARHSITGKVPTQWHHIDGKVHNSRPENITLLCPNCHSLTLTYGALNKGNGRGKHRKR